jgi:hypothetical protein
MTVSIIRKRSVRPLVLGLAAGLVASAVSLLGGGWAASADGGGTLPTLPSEPVVPGAPKNVEAEPGNKKATVSWEAPDSDGGSRVISYIVISDTAGAHSFGGGARHAVITGLVNGETYTFRVLAVNKVGEGPASEPSNPVTPAAPNESEEDTGNDTPDEDEQAEDVEPEDRKGRTHNRFQALIGLAKARLDLRLRQIEQHEKLRKMIVKANHEYASERAKLVAEWWSTKAADFLKRLEGTEAYDKAKKAASAKLSAIQANTEQRLAEIEADLRLRLDEVTQNHNLRTQQAKERIEQQVRLLQERLKAQLEKAGQKQSAPSAP